MVRAGPTRYRLNTISRRRRTFASESSAGRSASVRSWRLICIVAVTLSCHLKNLASANAERSKGRSLGPAAAGDPGHAPARLVEVVWKSHWSRTRLMRIAILTDIHANREALDATLHVVRNI